MDIRQHVTDKIIHLIEQGQTKGESMWDAAVQFGLPVNHQTKKPYSGINVLMLAYSTRWRTRFHADGGQHSTVIADTVPR